ncbi:tetratricopeptide repeat protein [Borrelia venezuelensis]|uniref:tetratricopeptide repeat protein n=1 Tax=Borrelia venezuelensis TaxID=1653839 RepID=UPI001FF2B49F|nr:tetratricopeptide repeat protein [Borrelia venezuelensis]UPA12126.1 tetratricopeptide repeat protein [Borrelia venezuelensis]
MNSIDFEKALELYKNGDLKNALLNLDVFDDSFDSLALKSLIYFRLKDYKALLYVLDTYPVLSEYRFLIKLLHYGKFEDQKSELSYFQNYNLGVFYFGLKDYAKSLSYFLKSSQQHPSLIQAINNAAILLEILGRKDEATQMLIKAVDVDKNNALVKLNVWFLKNNCIFNSAKPFEIDESFKEANLSLVVNYLMYYFYSIGEISSAIKLSERFLTDSNYSKYIWHNRATILHKIGNMTQATKSYVKAILNFPNIYTIYNMHIATIELLNFSPKRSIDRMLLDYPNMDSVCFYAFLFFLRNRELEDAYFYIKKLCEIKPDTYSKFLNLLESREDILIEELLDEFAMVLKGRWTLEYLFFIDNSLNLKDPVFVFDYDTRLCPYIWKIKDEHIELRANNNEVEITKKIFSDELMQVKLDVAIKEIRDLIEAYRDFKINC